MCRLKNNVHRLENYVCLVIHHNKQEASYGFLIIVVLTLFHFFFFNILFHTYAVAYCQSPDIQRKKCKSLPENNPLKMSLFKLDVKSVSFYSGYLGQVLAIGSVLPECTGKTLCHLFFFFFFSPSEKIEYSYFA